MKTINYAYFKLEEKTTRSVKNDKKQFYQRYRRQICHEY